MRTECQPLATDKLSLFSVSRGRCGNSELGKFSLPVNLLAHTSEMFIFGTKCPSYLSWRVCYDYITYSDHILVDTHTHLISTDCDSKNADITYQHDFGAENESKEFDAWYFFLFSRQLLSLTHR